MKKIKSNVWFFGDGVTPYAVAAKAYFSLGTTCTCCGKSFYTGYDLYLTLQRGGEQKYRSRRFHSLKCVDTYLKRSETKP